MSAGRTIVIVGASGEAEKRIVKLVGLTPGEVLNYPALAEAQRKLGLAGFPGASVQPHPSENGSVHNYLLFNFITVTE